MRILLFTLCLAELLLFTWLQNFAGIIISPVLFLGVSLGIAFAYLRLSKMAPMPVRPAAPWQKIIPIAAFAVLSALIAYTLDAAFTALPISASDTSQSDVIPTMMHMTKNFVAGKPPYFLITFPTYTTFPSYLPFQWMPYIVAEKLGFDYRWMAALSLWLAGLYFLIRNLPGKQNGFTPWHLLVPVWPLVAYFLLVKYYTYEFAVTVESMVAGYYLLLAAGLEKKRTWVIAIAIPMCLLSRMSIALWVPLGAIAFFIAGRRKQLVAVIATSAVFFIVFYWLPFVRRDPSLLFNPYKSYAYVTEAIWGRNALFNGMGFNSWAMQFMHGNIHHKVVNYVRLHFLLCTLTVACLTVFYWVRRRRYDLHTYLLFSLKVYLAIFYSFIQLPFTYLYIVPVLVSSALLAGSISRARG